MPIKLYVVTPSHPCRAAALMIERKGLDFERVDLTAGLHATTLRLLGFGAGTVPAMRIDGRRVQGSRQIGRALEEASAQPSLYPSDPEARRQAEEAERWGDETLQALGRRLFRWATNHDIGTVINYWEGSRQRIPIGLTAKLGKPMARAFARKVGATDQGVQTDLRALPELLDRVDRYIADGVIGGEEPGAADFQIATSVRILLTFEDVREAIEARPAAAFARRLCPDYQGRLRPIFPAEWLEPLRAPSLA